MLCRAAQLNQALLGDPRLILAGLMVTRHVASGIAFGGSDGAPSHPRRQRRSACPLDYRP